MNGTLDDSFTWVRPGDPQVSEPRRSALAVRLAGELVLGLRRGRSWSRRELVDRIRRRARGHRPGHGRSTSNTRTRSSTRWRGSGTPPRPSAPPPAGAERPHHQPFPGETDCLTPSTSPSSAPAWPAGPTPRPIAAPRPCSAATPRRAARGHRRRQRGVRQPHRPAIRIRTSRDQLAGDRRRRRHRRRLHRGGQSPAPRDRRGTAGRRQTRACARSHLAPTVADAQAMVAAARGRRTGGQLRLLLPPVPRRRRHRRADQGREAGPDPAVRRPLLVRLLGRPGRPDQLAVHRTAGLRRAGRPRQPPDRPVRAALRPDRLDQGRGAADRGQGPAGAAGQPRWVMPPAWRSATNANRSPTTTSPPSSWNSKVVPPAPFPSPGSPGDTPTTWPSTSSAARPQPGSTCPATPSSGSSTTAPTRSPTAGVASSSARHHPYVAAAQSMPFSGIGHGGQEYFTYQARSFLDQIAGLDRLPAPGEFRRRSAQPAGRGSHRPGRRHRPRRQGRCLMTPLRIGILGAARIADEGIVDPAGLGHQVVAVAARDQSRAARHAALRSVAPRKECSARSHSGPAAARPAADVA